jgi:hypothetical protein
LLIEKLKLEKKFKYYYQRLVTPPSDQKGSKQDQGCDGDQNR